ncbi:MAG: tetratricopeptide repeat protein, partial [Myxococcales bacterium]|nr:tetratricopeptide repeat protein [Myxococcales bacterium]
HLILARIFRDELKDRDRARAELKAVLQQDPTHSDALAALADLQFEHAQWADAAETLIRRARAEKSRSALKDIFFKLGLIYSEHLPDPKRAVASFTRVLSVTPDDIVALEHLSNLHVKEWEWKGALQATMRLAGLEPDPHKRVAHLHRVAKIYEDGFKDARHALAALRDAMEIDPLYLPSIGELAKFFDRQSDVQSMRVHLDRTSARIRQQLDGNPQDPTPYHSLFKIFGWRRAPDRAAFAAGTLEWLGAADSDEKAMLQKLTGRDNYPGSSLADPTLDETLFDARVPAGFQEAQVVAEAGRMARIIPKKLHGELLPFALECASESLDLKQIAPSLVHTANRAGLLCCGVPGPSLTAVRRLGDDAQLRALLRFTVSDELAELRRQLGTALG